MIRAYSLAPAFESVAILAAHLDVESMRIVNNGLIEADVAIRTSSSNWPETAADESIVNNATGTIRGDIETLLGADSLINRGLIQGNVFLGMGDDVFDSSGGIFSGYADLDWGEDEFIGGIRGDRATGGRMNDALSGNQGNDLLLGGLGDDRIDGGAGNDGLYGEYGDDVLVVKGADRAFGGAGNDRFELLDLSFAALDGGSGVDRILLPAAAGMYDLLAILGSGRVAGIEQAELRANGQAALRASAMTPAFDGLQIFGAGTSTLVLAGVWTDGGAVSASGVTYHAYSANGATVLVEQDIHVVQQAAAPGGLIGLSAVAGGSAAPLIENDPDLDLAIAVQTNVGFSVTEDTVLESYEVWRGGPDGAAISSFAREATFTNDGTITSAFGRAVSVDVLTLFVNNGTIRANAPELDGYATAFEANQWVPLRNTGTIIAWSGSGKAEAAIVNSFNEAGFFNSGLVRAESPHGIANGVFLAGLNSAGENTGRIEAIGGTRAMAVYLNAMSLDNSGTIQARAATPASAQDECALYVRGSLDPMEIHNSGVIKGATAIFMADEVYATPVHLTNAVDGRIIGRIVLAGDPDVVVNQGLIQGDVWLGSGNDQFDGLAGRVIGTVFGGAGADRITVGRGGTAYGEAGNDTLGGSAYADTLDGGTANDVLDGGGAADTLFGGNGDDVMIGGLGADTLSGGAGADRFVFAEAGDSLATRRDAISDFSSAQHDTIDLSAIDAILGGGDDAFTLVDRFHGIGGELLIRAVTEGHWRILGDIDGDRGTDFAIDVYSASGLTAADFLL